MERADLIQRRTLRAGRGHPVRRIFTLTEHGREVASLLSGKTEPEDVAR